MSFDPVEYFRTIQQQLRETSGDNRFYRVTGLSNLEELMLNIKRAQYPLICVDDSQDGVISGITEGFWDSRYYSVFILARVKRGDDDDRASKMEQCRIIFFKILTRLIKDAREFEDNEHVYLHPDRIKYDEVGYIANDLHGIHFGFVVENPKDLTYNESDWDLGSS